MKLNFLSLLSLPMIAIAGGWEQTCGGYNMYEQGTELLGSCEDGSGGIVESYLELNSCLSNINGVIHWQPNGGFGGSCSYDGNLCWTCGDGRGGYVYQCPPFSR
jgi:hypothetical protein